MNGPEDAMTAERWSRLEALFQEALEGSPEERERLLRKLQRDKPSLASELSGLLEAHEALAAADATEGEDAFLGRLDAARAAALVEEVGEVRSDRRGTVGPYRIEGLLGEGGMGVVYRAFDPRLEREVAVKLLPRWLAADASARERFSREARAASALDHPNIATIYEIDLADDGHPYIAMAYYPGRTLAGRLERGPLLVEEVVTVARGMLQGLRAAHRAGIIHRDVKPANVVLTEDGMVKLLDFGVAKVTGSHLTRVGRPLGTAAYMSPEQTRGEEVEPRSDLWSVGVVLYELLAGRRPFAAREPDALVYQIRNDPPTPLNQLRPNVPEWLASLVDHCLQKSPEARPGSAGELLARLEAEGVGSSSPVQVGGPGTRMTIRRWGRRAWIAAGVLGIGLSWALTMRGGGGASTVGVRVDEPATLAVLPFEALNPGEDAAIYARGIHDDLITRLSSVSGLRVTSRRAVENLPGDQGTIAEVAEGLGVRWILEGSVSASAAGLRINARLVDPWTESQAWARGYRRPLTAESLQELPGEIATEVALSLSARASPRDPGAPPVDLATYRSWVEGRTNLEQRTEAGVRRGAQAFREALARTPDHAPSWAGLSEALSLLVNYGYELSDAGLPESRAAADRALALDRELSDAHAALGLVTSLGEPDGPQALASLRRALELEPSHARAALWLGNVLIAAGRLEDARVPLIRAAELDPTSAPARLALARWYQFTGRLDAALAEARLGVRLAPSSPAFSMVLGEILRELDRPGEAQVVLERALGLPGVNPQGFPGLWVELALVYEARGRPERAESLLAEIDDRTPPSVRAAVEASRGNREEALSLLAESPLVPGFSGILRYHHVWESVRGEPAFQEMLTRYDEMWGVGGGNRALP